MGDARDHQDFEGSEEAKELPNVIPKCHKKPTVSHTPYRSSCKHCVAGRAPNLPHRPRRHDQGALKNEIAADYCFLRIAARDVSQAASVARDRRTGNYIAHAVPLKGAGVESFAKKMLRDVRKCGYHGRVDPGRMASPRSWTQGEVARLGEPQETARVMGLERGQFDMSRT